MPQRYNVLAAKVSRETVWHGGNSSRADERANGKNNRRQIATAAGSLL